MFVAPVERQLLLRTYAIRLKKSGTKVFACLKAPGGVFL